MNGSNIADIATITNCDVEHGDFIIPKISGDIEKDAWEEEYLKRKNHFMENARNLLNKRNPPSNDGDRSLKAETATSMTIPVDSPTVSLNIIENTLKEYEKEKSKEAGLSSDNELINNNYENENMNVKLKKSSSKHKSSSSSSKIQHNSSSISSNSKSCHHNQQHEIAQNNLVYNSTKNSTSNRTLCHFQNQSCFTASCITKNSDLSSIVAKKLEIKNKSNNNNHKLNDILINNSNNEINNNKNNDVNNEEDKVILNCNINNNLQAFEEMSYFMSIDDSVDNENENNNDAQNIIGQLTTNQNEVCSMSFLGSLNGGDGNKDIRYNYDMEMINMDQEIMANCDFMKPNIQSIIPSPVTSSKSSSPSSLQCQICSNGDNIKMGDYDDDDDDDDDDEIKRNTDDDDEKENDCDSDTLNSNVSISNLFDKWQLNQKDDKKKLKSNMNIVEFEMARERTDDKENDMVKQQSEQGKKRSSRRYDYKEGLRIDELESKMERMKQELEEKNCLIDHMQHQITNTARSEVTQLSLPPHPPPVSLAPSSSLPPPIPISSTPSLITANRNLTINSSNLHLTEFQPELLSVQPLKYSHIKNHSLLNSQFNHSISSIPDFDPNSTAVLKNKIRDLESQVQDLQEANEVASKFITNYRTNPSSAAGDIQLESTQLINELRSQNSALKKELELMRKTNSSKSNHMNSGDIPTSQYLRNELDSLKNDLKNLKEQNNFIVIENIRLKQAIKTFENGRKDKVNLNENQNNLSSKDQYTRRPIVPRQTVSITNLENHHNHDLTNNTNNSGPSPILNNYIKYGAATLSNTGEIVEHNTKEVLEPAPISITTNNQSNINPDIHVTTIPGVAPTIPKSNYYSNSHNSVLVNMTTTTTNTGGTIPHMSQMIFSGYDNDIHCSSVAEAVTTEVVNFPNGNNDDDDDIDDLTDEMLGDQLDLIVHQPPQTFSISRAPTTNHGLQMSTATCTCSTTNNTNTHTTNTNTNTNTHNTTQSSTTSSRSSSPVTGSAHKSQQNQQHSQYQSQSKLHNYSQSHTNHIDSSSQSNKSLHVTTIFDKNATENYKSITSEVIGLDQHEGPFSTLHRFAFAPKSGSEITRGDIVKFIRQGGRISKGLVHFIGRLPRRNDVYIGVELELEDGKHDGVYEGNRYFKCKENKGVFVAFNKVIMVYSKQQ